MIVLVIDSKEILVNDGLQLLMLHLEQARQRIFHRRRIVVFGREEDVPDERRVVRRALPPEADGQLQLLQLTQFAFQLGDFE